MKTTILVYAFTLCLASLNALIPPPISTSYELAEAVVAAHQHESVDDYEKLIPTSKELGQLVEDNQDFYGTHLMEAKAELQLNYTANTIPEMKRTFELVIEQGKKKGIDWSKVQLESVKFGATENDIHIVLNYSGNHFQLRLEKVLRIKGEWRATQFITLV